MSTKCWKKYRMSTNVVKQWLKWSRRWPCPTTLCYITNFWSYNGLTKLFGHFRTMLHKQYLQLILRHNNANMFLTKLLSMLTMSIFVHVIIQGVRYLHAGFRPTSLPVFRYFQERNIVKFCFTKKKKKKKSE